MKPENVRGTHYLYRCFAWDGELLYVGLTCNTDQRFRAHKNSTPWWDQVVRCESVAIGSDRIAAHLVESAVILDEQPKYNKYGKKPHMWKRHHAEYAEAQHRLPISFAEADRIAAEDDSVFAKAFRATLSADPADRRVAAIVRWAMTGGVK